MHFTMSQRHRPKRARSDPTTVEDVMFYARILMKRDPFEHLAPQDENRRFRAMFGCTDAIVLKVWSLMKEHEVLHEGRTLMHLLWTFLYCKTYTKWAVMKIMTNSDPKTIRKWIGLFLVSVSLLEPYLVCTLLCAFNC